MEVESPKRRARRGRQFGLLAIFVLLTVCAAIAGVTRLIDVPPFARYAFAGYLIMLAIPLVLRGPGWVRMWLGTSAEMRRIRAQREQLSAWADQRRREHRGETGDDDEGRDG